MISGFMTEATFGFLERYDRAGPGLSREVLSSRPTALVWRFRRPHHFGGFMSRRNARNAQSMRVSRVFGRRECALALSDSSGYFTSAFQRPGSLENVWTRQGRDMALAGSRVPRAWLVEGACGLRASEWVALPDRPAGAHDRLAQSQRDARPQRGDRRPAADPWRIRWAGGGFRHTHCQH